jgi:hypothetical protein
LFSDGAISSHPDAEIFSLFSDTDPFLFPGVEIFFCALLPKYFFLMLRFFLFTNAEIFSRLNAEILLLVP